jgi:hypothetical protein
MQGQTWQVTDLWITIKIKSSMKILLNTFKKNVDSKPYLF